MMLSQKIRVYIWHNDLIQAHWHVEKLSKEHCDYYSSINASHFQKDSIHQCNKHTRWVNWSNLWKKSHSKLLTHHNQYTDHNDAKSMTESKLSEAFLKWWAENSMNCDLNALLFHNIVDVAVWFSFIDSATCVYQSDLHDSVSQASSAERFFFA